MTFIVPAFLLAALGVAAGVVVLHLLVLRPPPAAPLPTARFVPFGTSTVRRLVTRPRDRRVMGLRVLTVLFAGLAFAQPVFRTRRLPFERVTATDSLGSLSATMAAAVRAGFRAAARADTVELVVVSPFTTGESDAATMAIRGSWPGAIHAVRAPAPSDTTRAHVVWPAASGGDTVGAVAMLGASPPVVAVAPFVRPRGSLPDSGGRVVARWVDGTAAAVDRSVAAGCERTVAIGLPSDTTRAVATLIRALTSEPCGAGAHVTPMSDSVLRAFAGIGSSRVAIRRPAPRANPVLIAVLVALALAASVTELVIR